MKTKTITLNRSKVFLVGLVIAFFSFISCKNNVNKNASSTVASEEIYTCPMHPQIIRHEPGNCPICGMPLVKKENASREVSQVDLSSLLQANNNTVVSSIPVTTMQLAKKQINLEALGSIDYDRRFMYTISSRVSGRIEKLYIKYRFQPVHKGDKIMDIYSPELLTAQQDLLFLVKNDPSNSALINSAKEKLLLLGMTQNQLQKIISSGKAMLAVSVYSNYSGHVHESGTPSQSQNTMSMNGPLSIKEGMYVEKGEPVFQVNNMNHVWITLNFFPGEDSLIQVGTPVTIIPETAPDKKILSKIDFIEPFYKNNSKTISARVYVDNSMLMLPVGSQVKASVTLHTKFNNWLPKESVLSLGLNKIVFLKKGSVFHAHTVTTGISTDELVQIMNGLNPQDSVAVNAQFLIGSEGFIKVNGKVNGE